MNAQDFRNYNANSANEIIKEQNDSQTRDEKVITKHTNIFLSKATKYMALLDSLKSGEFSEKEKNFLKQTETEIINYLNAGPNSIVAIMKEINKRVEEFAKHYENLSSKDIEHIKVSARDTKDMISPVLDDRKLSKDLKKFYVGFDYINSFSRFLDHMANNFGEQINNEALYKKMLLSMDKIKNIPCFKEMEESLKRSNLNNANQPHPNYSFKKLNETREEEFALQNN